MSVFMLLGAIDHISIRTLQCILLKAALLLGVEIHAGTSFEGLIEPPENSGKVFHGTKQSYDTVNS